MAGDIPGAAELRNPTLSRGEIFREEIKLSRGGGGGYDPQEPIDVQRRLSGSAAAIAHDAAQRTPEELGSSGRVVVEAKVLPNYLAASSTPTDLIHAAGLTIVGTRPARGVYETKQRVQQDAPAKIYLLSGTPDAAVRLASFLKPGAQIPDKPFDQLRQLDDLALGGPQTVVDIDVGVLEHDDDGRALLEAVLHPQIGDDGPGDVGAQEANVRAFDAYVHGLDTGARVGRAAIEDGVAFVPVAADPATIPAIGRYTQLRVLRPMTVLREPPVVPGADDGWALEGIQRSVDTEGERIAVFDGGVSPQLQELLGDLLTVTDVTGGQAILPVHERHGGWVVSAALFGPLNPREPTPVAGLPVDAYRVWPPPREVGHDEELHWVLDRIEEVLSAGRHRIAVITLAPKINADHRAEPHRWTAALDRIAREHDVLICVAAGNTGDLAPDADRLLIPADAINVLSVGAATSLAGQVVRADYSSVGPGRPGQTAAPTGVQFGGDVAAGLPFYALGPDGTVEGINGTSVAAPVVARACGLLRHALGANADANLLRCLSAHGADRPAGSAKATPGSTAREVGFGRLPADLVAQLENEADAVTVVFRDTVLRGQQIALQFPFPDDLFADYANKQFRLHWTLSFLTGIETSSPVDYATSGFDVFYRPHAMTFTLRDDDDPNFKPMNVNRLLEPHVFDYEVKRGRQVSDRPATGGKPGWATEVERRAIHGKWETLVRVDGKPQGKGLFRPGIDLQLLTRAAGSLRHEPEPTTFALAVSLHGPKGSGVYQRVVQYAPALVPLVATVPAPIHARARA